MSKVVAIIQQRMGSTRLPGKALLPLAGKSMTQNIVERVSRAKLVDQVVVAIPKRDCLRLTPNKIGTHEIYFPYDAAEIDLVCRLFRTAVFVGATHVVRVCGDNPCVEWRFIDELIKMGWDWNYKTRGWKLITNAENIAGQYDGFGGEFYPIEMLRWMEKTIKAADYREHISNFWHELKRSQYVGKPYPAGFRLDVNTPADYKKLKKVYGNFRNNKFHVDEAVKFVQENQL